MTTRNRLWVPPMCQYSVDQKDGKPTAYHVYHYGALARGGAGAVIVEMTGVEPSARISPYCLGLWSDEHTHAHQKIVQAIHDGGITVDETVQVAAWLKEDGVDMADISTSGNYPANIKVYAGYQTPMAAQVKRDTQIPVAAVGMINSPRLAEYIIGSEQADVVLVGREALRNPSFALHWARELNTEVDYAPSQYARAWRTRR